ncbi:unnamed protein product [Owenia fusiformis]|uniref:VWFA domain-containing protein n=1 Tax=Owenia fusiformis TaxID=6347 RepID=A0A8S4PI59_OWEFU|nr:unnamed protein product [Owenia fusiformis]
MDKWMINFIFFFTILHIGRGAKFSGPLGLSNGRLRVRPRPPNIFYDPGPPRNPMGPINPEEFKICPAKYLSGNPITREKISKCQYFTCSPGGIYKKHSCPNGLAVQVSVRRKWQYDRTGVDYMPCTRISLGCVKPIAGNGTGQISDTPVEICGIDLVFAADISCSISPANKAKVKKFIIAASSSIPVRSQYSRIGVLTFSDKVYHVAYMNEFTRQSQLIERLKAMTTEPLACGTRTDEGLREAREKYFSKMFGSRPDRQKVLIVLSDGFTYPTSFQKDTFYQANLIHKANIQTHVVGLPNLKLLNPPKDAKGKATNRFTPEAAREEWLKIASKPENVFTLSSFDQLFLQLNQIVKTACFTI